MLARTKKKMAKQLQRRQKRKFRFWADRSKTICKNHQIDRQWDDLNWHSHPQKSPVFDPRKGNREDAKDTLEKHLCKDSIMKSGFINLSLQGKVYKTSLHNTVNIQCVQNCERPKLKTLDSLGLPRTHWRSQCVTNRRSDRFRMNHCKYIQTLPYFKKLYNGIILLNVI